MSLPPNLVQIKRKRTDEPVDFLRVHESHGKRQRRTPDFVFSRQANPDVSTNAAPVPEPVRRIKQLPRASSSSSLRARAQQSATSYVSSYHAAQNDTEMALDRDLPRNETATPAHPAVRRFHISRSGTAPSDQSSTVAAEKRPIIFSERRIPKRSRSPPPATRAENPEILSTEAIVDAVPPRPLKKPGLASRISAKTVVSSHNVSLPKSTPTLSSEERAAEMQAFTLQEIARSLAVSDASRSSPSKFKPKKPALRYHERHPETVSPSLPMEDVGAYDVDMDDETDYVIDTYIRVHVGEVESENEQNYGLLVLDTQPDIDEFYKAHMEEEDEEEDIEEDENAENHYSADYPDEEIDSDDEFGRNAHFFYRKDLDEEYGDDEAAFSDEGDDAQRYPWAKSTWVNRANVDNEDESENEDGEPRFNYTDITLAQLSRAR